MLRRTLFFAWALAVLSLLAACGRATTPSASAPSQAAEPPTRAATTTPVTAAPSVQSATAAATPAASSIPEGVTAEGYHMRGQPNAPVTLVMYSDFL